MNDTYYPGMAAKMKKDEIEKVVSAVCGRVEYTEREQSEMRATWEEVYKAYNAVREYSQTAGAKKPESRILSPTLSVYIDKLVQMLTVRLVVPQENFIQANFREDKTRLYPVENFLFDNYKREGWSTPAIDATLAACLFRTGFTKVVPIDESAYPRFALEFVPNQDLFIDPSARDLQSASYVIHRVRKGTREVLSTIRQGMVYNIESEVKRFLKDNEDKLDMGGDRLSIESLNAPEVQVPSDMKEFSPTLAKRVFPESTAVSLGPVDDDTETFDKHLIYEYYDKSVIVTIIDKKYLVRYRYYNGPYPFQAWQVRRDPKGGMWPRSFAELVMDICNEIDVKRNQRIMGINLQVDPVVIHTKNAVSDVRELVIVNGKKIAVNDMNGIDFLKIPDRATETLAQEIGILKGEVQEALGTVGVVMGEAAKGDRMTRAETSSVYSQANLPFDFASSLLSITGLIPAFQMVLTFCSSIWKGIGAKGSVQPTGKGEVVEIPPNVFGEDIDITLSINPDKVTKDKMNALELLNILAQFPIVDQVVLLNWLIPRVSPDRPEGLINQQTMGQPIPQPVQTNIQ